MKDDIGSARPEADYRGRLGIRAKAARSGGSNPASGLPLLIGQNGGCEWLGSLRSQRADAVVAYKARIPLQRVDEHALWTLRGRAATYSETRPNHGLIRCRRQAWRGNPSSDSHHAQQCSRVAVHAAE